jgi:hypothetical protein
LAGKRERFLPPAGGGFHFAELFAATLLMLVEANGTYLALFLSESVSLAALAFFILFFAYVIAFATGDGGGVTKKRKARRSLLLHLVFAAMVAAFALSMTIDPRLSLGELAFAAITLYPVALYFVLLLPLFFFTLFAAYFARVKHDYRVAAVLLLLVLLVLVLYYASHFLMRGFTIDDEELLSLASIRFLLNGTNPYSASISSSLYQFGHQITITTNNQIIGVMDYPALFFLTFAPFYFASAPTVQNLGAVDMPLQATAFVFVLLIVFAFVIREEDLLAPKFLLLASLAMPIAYVTSTTTYLMLALILLAYAKIDSKYAWIVLGLCLSLQEELWLPVLFLFAYSVNRHGIRKGAYNIIGAAAVFLAINAYFIAIGPGTFAAAVFSPLGKLMLPGAPSPFILPLIKGYPLLLSAYSQVFELLTALLALVLLYVNRKELIPVFSLAALVAIPHALAPYYAFFMFFIVFAVCTRPEETARGAIEGALKRRKWVFCSIAAALIACMAFVVLASHATYARNFNVSLVNQSLTQNAIGNTTTYRAEILYGGLGNGTVYSIVDAQGGLSTEWLGLLNQTLLPSGSACGAGAAYECYVNTNRLELPSGGTEYNLTLDLPWINGTRPVTYAAVALYNGEYFYIGKGTAYSGR